MKSPDLPKPEDPPLEIGKWFSPFPNFQSLDSITREDYASHEAKFVVLGLGSISSTIWWDIDQEHYGLGGIFLNEIPKIENPNGLMLASKAMSKRLMAFAVGLEPDQKLLGGSNPDLAYRVETRMGESGGVAYSNLMPLFDQEPGKNLQSTVRDNWRLYDSSIDEGKPLFIPYAEYIMSNLQMRIVPVEVEALVDP